MLDVPKGCVNLAANKPVTSSDRGGLVVGALNQITDGVKSWDANACVEIGPDKQYVQIDLNTNAVIYAIRMWHYHSFVPDVDVPKDVVVQVASDSTFTNSVGTVFNCDADNTLGLGQGNDMPFGTSKFGKTVYVNARPARFVRVYGRGSHLSPMTRFVEIEVDGVPSP